MGARVKKNQGSGHNPFVYFFISHTRKEWSFGYKIMTAVFTFLAYPGSVTLSSLKAFINLLQKT